MVFRWSLSDSKSHQVSRALLSILPDLNNAVVWMVSTRPLISKFSSSFINPSMIIPRETIAIGINVTFMFHSFSISKQGRGTYPSFHFLSILLCGQSGRQYPQFCKFSFFFVNCYQVWSSGRDKVIRLYLKIPLEFLSHSSGQMLVGAYTICSYGQI